MPQKKNPNTAAETEAPENALVADTPLPPVSAFADHAPSVSASAISEDVSDADDNGHADTATPGVSAPKPTRGELAAQAIAAGVAEAKAQNRADGAILGKDPTPNENYTLHGVNSGLPTPETDAEARRAAQEATGIR